jgi:hypothetical protein
MMASVRERSRLVSSAGTAALAGLAVVIGWAVSAGHSKALLLGTAILVLAVLALARRGAFVGVLLVAALNGLPFINTSQVVTAKLPVADVATMSIILVATAWLLLDNRAYAPTSMGRTLSRAATALLAWWLFILVHTIVVDHVSALHAASFGRDFLYFSLLLIVLPRVGLGRKDITTLLAILAGASCLYAGGQIVTTLGLGSVHWLIHVTRTAQQEGLTRLYSNMTDLVVAVLATAAVASLLVRDSKVRAIAIAIASLLTVSIVLQLTRARWIGLVIGLLLVTLVVMSRHGEAATTLRRRLVPLLGLAGIIGIAAVILAPGIFSGGTFAHRILSIASDLESGSGTVAIRETVTRTMSNYLGGQWPSGLGLIPPSAHYYPGLPAGSIRDPDLGVLNAVMTMGVIGACLIYLPVALMLANSMRSVSRPGYAWLCYGGSAWLAATLISSITLVTLFSASGLTLTAVLLTVLANPLLAKDFIGDAGRASPPLRSSYPATALRPISQGPHPQTVPT